MGEFFRSAVIPAGQSVSDKIYLEGGHLVGVAVPADWEGNANITLLAAAEPNATFRSVFDRQGNEYVIVTTVDRFVAILFDELPGLMYVQLRSGTAAVAINQTGQKTIQLTIRT